VLSFKKFFEQGNLLSSYTRLC